MTGPRSDPGASWFVIHSVRHLRCISLCTWPVFACLPI